MFDNDELREASRTPKLIWAIISGGIALAILANLIDNGIVPMAGAFLVGFIVYKLK